MTFRDDCHWCLRIGQFKKKKHTAKRPCDRFRSMEKFKLRRSVPDGGGGSPHLGLMTRPSNNPPVVFLCFQLFQHHKLWQPGLFFPLQSTKRWRNPVARINVGDVCFLQTTDTLQPSMFLCAAALCFCNTCCVSIQGLHPLEEHLKANYVTTASEGCPNPKAPPNAHSFPSFWRMHDYYPSWPFLHAQKREKIATLRGVDRHFCGPGWQKSWRKGKTSGDTTRKCSKG